MILGAIQIVRAILHPSISICCRSEIIMYSYQCGSAASEHTIERKRKLISVEMIKSNTMCTFQISACGDKQRRFSFFFLSGSFLSFSSSSSRLWISLRYIRSRCGFVFFFPRLASNFSRGNSKFCSLARSRNTERKSGEGGE